MEKFNIQGVQTLRGNRLRVNSPWASMLSGLTDTIPYIYCTLRLFYLWILTYICSFLTQVYVIEKIISNNWLTRNPRYITIVTIVIYNVVITMCLLYTDYIHIHDKQECNAPCFLTGMSCEKLVFLCSHPLRGLQDSVYY